MVAKHKKLKITRTLVEKLDIDGDLDEFIETLNKIKEDHPGYDRYYIDALWYDYDGNYPVKGARYETDEEFSKRVESIKKEKKSNEEQHKKEIEKEARRLGLIK